MKTAADMARAAGDLIATHGLAKGQLYDEDTGGYCFLGALYEVSDNNHSFPDLAFRVEIMDRAKEIMNRAKELLNAEHGEPDCLLSAGGTVVDFNNDPQTTAEDVILLFKRTAESLEGE